MNLSENLKKLRKEKGLSQEQLAEKLNVTRQSVSKWESGIVYPEMDKIVELCKIFDLNMDDLVNKDINNKSHNPFKKILSYFEQIIKTFDSMSNEKKINCFIEQIIVLIVVSILFSILERFLFADTETLTQLLPSILSGIINFIVATVYNITKISLTLGVMFYIFKVRYLENAELQKELKEAKEVKETEKTNEVKVNTEAAGVFKIFIFIFKFFVLWGLLLLIMMAVGLGMTLGLTVFIYKTGFLFLGAFLLILGLLLITLVFIGMAYNLLIDKKAFNKFSLLTIVISLITIGASSGIMALGLNEFQIIDDINSEYYSEKTYVLPMNDKQTFLASNSDIIFVEKDIDNIEVIVKSYQDCDLISFNYEDPQFYRTCRSNTPEIIKNILNDINNKKLVNYFKKEMIVYASSENIIKLVNNRKHFGDYDFR